MRNFTKALALIALLIGIPFFAKAIDVKCGDKLAILSGQSFDCWSWSPSGYLHLMAGELIKSGLTAEPSIVFEGQNTEQMLACVDDVIAKKPGYALLIPGTADYNPWRDKSVSESFTKNLAAVIGKLKEANIKLVLATSYASNSNLALTFNSNIGEHNDAIRALAKEYGLASIDFVTVVDREKKAVPFDGSLVAKALVNQMFAAEVLRSMGFGDKEVAAFRAEWLDAPGAVQFKPSVSVNTYDKLKTAAKVAGKDVGTFMTEVLREKIR